MSISTPIESPPLSSSTESRELQWPARRPPTIFGISIVLLSILCGLVTYGILTGLTPIQPTPDVIFGLLAANLILVLIMGAIIGWQAVGLWRAKRRGIAGAQLHIRIVGLFAIVAILPTIVVAVFASVTLERGLDTWFSDRTRTIVDTAQIIAESYIHEQGQLLRGDLIRIREFLDQQKRLFDDNRPGFYRSLATQLALHELHAAYVIDIDRKFIEASVTANSRIEFRPPDDSVFDQLREKDEAVIIDPGTGNVVRGLIRLDLFDNAYLYLYRLINPEVLQHLQRTRLGKAEYDAMLEQRQGVQLTFALMYVGVSFIFLLAAIWLGLWFADRLVEPVVGLVGAAHSVSLGDFDAKVRVGGQGDLATLGRTFNRMTAQLKSQRNALLQTNEQLDKRNQFTEAVLAGASAGVIGLDKDCVITLVNRSACTILARGADEMKGRSVSAIIPEIMPILNRGIKRGTGSAEGNVVMHIHDEERTLTVRLTSEEEREHGYVVTLDDVTNLVVAQRNSAWADIARRIAHEIRNPLTPIQLSAERLKRKYGTEISSDREVFDRCTDTIIRQVGDIGRMVDEFSSFARMPKAEFVLDDLVRTVDEAVALERIGNERIEFDIHLPTDPIMVFFDRRLIAQSVINVVKNARESIEARIQRSDGGSYQGRIRVDVLASSDTVTIDITDNGIGLPKKNRHRLTEPYMTTRGKGTGLGLAIIKRIMEEHKGRLSLHDAPEAFSPEGGGALIRLSLSSSLDSVADVTDSTPSPDVQKQRHELMQNGHDGAEWGNGVEAGGKDHSADKKKGQDGNRKDGNRKGGNHKSKAPRRSRSSKKEGRL